MATSNITRDEAAARAAVLSVDSYVVDLDLTTDKPGSDTHYWSTTTVTFSASTPGATSWIDLIAQPGAVSEAVLNGETLDAAALYDGFRLQLPNLAAENTLVVKATNDYNTTGVGLHRLVDPADGEVYLYTQFEEADARRMFACFDQPDLKATYEFRITAPAHWLVVSNAPAPAPVAARDGFATWNFPATKKMSTYITALIGGPYHKVEDSYTGQFGTIPLGIFCRTSMVQYLEAEDMFRDTKDGFAFFEKTFNTPYPFEKYDQVVVPQFNAGAMENAGCVTFNEDLTIYRGKVPKTMYIWRTLVILHEMAHMWFGNLVTMKWWDDLWLNESFAEYSCYYAMSKGDKFDKEAWVEFNALRKTWGYTADQLPSTHPIQGDVVDLDSVRANFDGISYAKGASTLRQLVSFLGEDAFNTGVANYLHKFAWGNARLDDLLVELEASSGRDLKAWTKDWLQTPGVNTLRPEIVVTDGKYESVTVVQEPPRDPAGLPATLRSHRIGIGRYSRDAEGNLVQVGFDEVDVAGERTVIDALAGQPAADLLLLNDGDYTFTKIRLDEASAATATSSLGKLANPLARALIWSASWDMTRDAEMSIGDYLTLAESTLPYENNDSAIEAALRNLATGIALYSAPENRDGYRDRFVALLKSGIEATAPGSSSQLQVLKAYASNLRTPEQAAFVREVLDGKVTLEGLPMDTELKWHLLGALAALGLTDDAEIDAFLANDPTSNGQDSALTVRTRLPQAEKKAAAWNAVFNDEKITNSALRSYAAGFWHIDQLELTRPYVEKYFAEIEDAFAKRAESVAMMTSVALFPSIFIEQPTLDKVTEFSGRELHTALKRYTAENKDRLERALRCQAKDA